jgi:Raf kinase inhibitor-like YbhB/YbcL family protein
MFKIHSNDWSEGARMPFEHVLNGMGLTGGNLSPHISWSGAPAGTKSYVLLVHDPDAPTGSGWWHWVVYDLPASTTELKRGAGDAKGSGLPASAKQCRTDFGAPGYGGAAPPEGHGVHRYQLTVYAMPQDKLPVPDDPSAAMIGFFARQTALASATLTVIYNR